MRRIFIASIALLIAGLNPAPALEYVVLSGGPALRKWEKSKTRTHDVFWGNFVESATIRLSQLKAKIQPGDRLVWLVYRPAYNRRQAEEKENLIQTIQVKADALGVALYWFDTAAQLLNYLNAHPERVQHPVMSLDFFGHSNKVNWMFDYSNELDGASVVFLHTRDLAKLNKAIFHPQAEAHSWGCHSGEYYSEKFFERAGVKMWGAVGKTDYSGGGLPTLSSDGGRWTQ